MQNPKNKRKALRQIAENELKQKPSSPARKADWRDFEKLLHELQVHQLELEIQTEELLRIQQDLEESRNRYRDLYDYAPIGYFTLDGRSRITDVNLSGSELLKLERKRLCGSPFTRFIAAEETDGFYLYFKKACSSSQNLTIELNMQKFDKTPFFARLEGLKAGNDGMRLALIDITDRKKAEADLVNSKNELETRVGERTRELEEANNQLKQYGHRITQVQEEERKRIAYELHDDTAQYLSVIKLQLDALLESGKIQDQEVIQKLEYLEKDADRAFNDVRRYSHELRPTVLEHLGLQAALEQIAEDTNKLKEVGVEVSVTGSEPELGEDVKLGLFRIAQEALNNARKHAKASEVRIQLHYRDSRVRMTVSDNGVGFDVEEAIQRTTGKGSLGLISMQERARLIGAELKVHSRPGKGTAVSAEVHIQ